MNERDGLGRREFTLAFVMAALSGVTITISGCGGGDGSSPTSPNNPSPPVGPGDKAASSIAGNHGHTAVITAAQLTSAASVQIALRGQADHPHTVNLSAAEVTQIAANQRVAKDSTIDMAHSHIVTFN
jgi:hypothetical protein